jgi:hypothetical protein
VHGVIRDASGGTIAKARVIEASMLNVGPSTEAGDDGAYELCVPVGGGAVMVRADGYADTYAAVSAFGRVRRDFELVPEAIVAGHTVRVDDGSPVANARIIARSHDFTLQRMPVVSALSDVDGQFRFRGLGPGRYTVTATADHFASAETVEVTADVTSPSEDVECKLVPALSISGRVVDKRTARPLADITVTVRAPESTDVVQSARSRTDGTFALENLVPGDYQVGVMMATPPAPLDVRLQHGDVEGLTIEMDAGASIAGRVLYQGRPVDGASVRTQPASPDSERSFRGAEDTANADGQFVLRGLSAGSYRVYAQSNRIGAFTHGPLVTVGEHEDKTGVDVELDLSGSIAGTVIDQNDQPVVGAHLRFSLLQGSDFGEASSADDGTFAARALSGGGDYVYEVRASSDSPIKFRAASGTRFTPIPVRDGTSHVSGVRIQVQFERLSISGRVVSNEGAGLADVAVSAQPRHAPGWRLPTTTTDATGAFTIPDLPNGQYAVVARSPRGSRRADGVRAGAHDVELRLPAVGSIEGTLEGFTAAPMVFAFYAGDGRGPRSQVDDDLMMPTSYRATVAGTAFSIKDVPAGDYRLKATAKDGHAEASVTVVPRRTARAVLRNAGFGSLEGRVTDATTREPVAGLLCVAVGDEDAVRVDTDASGGFRIERIAAGNIYVGCHGDALVAGDSVDVEAGKTAHVELTAEKRTDPERGYSGLQLAAPLSDVVVKSVASGSPAERGGVKVGDIVRALDGRELGDYGNAESTLFAIELRGAGSTVKLTLERDGKRQAVALQLVAAP